MERSFHFKDYSLPEGDSYASIEALIIEICLARILIFGSAIPQRTLDFHAVMIQSVWDQEGKKPLSSHHTFPSFEFHPMNVSAYTC
jgi:anti-sigma factor RsiW